MNPIDVLKSVLEAYGKLTVDEIAAILQKQNVKGECHDGEICLFAWVDRALGWKNVAVGSDCMSVACHSSDERSAGMFNLPETVQQTITSFDAGLFPELLVDEDGPEYTGEDIDAAEIRRMVPGAAGMCDREQLLSRYDRTTIEEGQGSGSPVRDLQELSV